MMVRSPIAVGPALAGLLISTVLGACTRGGPSSDLRSPAAMPQERPVVQAHIEVTGAGVDRALVRSFEQLTNMKMSRLNNILMAKSHEEDELTSWEGPPLAALLAAAGLRPGRMRIALRAADGYQISAELEELRGALVALKDGEGHWLAESDADCALRLVVPERPGNYWLMNLNRITVEPIDDAPAGP